MHIDSTGHNMTVMATGPVSTYADSTKPAARGCECNGAVEHVDSTRWECIGEYNSAVEHIGSTQQARTALGQVLLGTRRRR
jgi:hypothetical protein